MTEAGHIYVRFASVAEAATHCSSTLANMNSELDDLRNTVAKVAGSWSGAAAEAYQAKQQQWNQAQQDLGAVLQQIAKALENAHDAYTTTESTNKGIWG